MIRLRSLGLNYAWGLFSFTLGVALASAVTGFAARGGNAMQMTRA
jgi:hypothetical protein